MRTKIRSTIFICAVAILLITLGVQAQTQNLFYYDYFVGPNQGKIIELGVVNGGEMSESIFATFPPEYYPPGTSGPTWTTHGDGMAINSFGDVFLSDTSGNIFEYTPNGVRSAFATGIHGSLAIDNAGNLYVADNSSGNIYKYTPGGSSKHLRFGDSSREFDF